MLPTIAWDGDEIVMIDQRKLPLREVYVRCRTGADVAKAIKTMVIRGAPAIGVAAAYGYALAATCGEDLDAAYDELVAARPTAVNLAWALSEMRSDPTPERARALHEAEVGRCRRMAQHAGRAAHDDQRRLCAAGAGSGGGDTTIR